MIVAKRPDVRREELIDAAEALFLERGYEATKVTDIIDRVGIAKGTFYYYFRSKEEILFAMARRHWVDLEGEMRRIIDDPGTPALQKIASILEAAIRLNRGRGSLFDTIHDTRYKALHDRLVSEGVESLVPILVGVVEQGRKEGAFDTEHPRMAVEFLFMGSSFVSDPYVGKELSEVKIALADFHDRVLGATPGTFLTIFEKVRERSRSKDIAIRK